ncbi:related to metalloproteinase penicillolysin [Rhynchosporium secalis]|uniref:deuterolysin n=1 Tax=Rhynchosporium secalis TaxID=38038 RepID=A0A1E1MVN3_RHYSE|nr:related to metalloproteinase penicillolysin [Rhynchosporium secalis]
MFQNIALPALALVGVATAACPFSIEITGAENHVAQVAVTNTGAETVTVFKGNTVFSEHATKDLLVTADGVALPFEGIDVNYRKSDLTPEMFQVIAPGETVTASVNAAKTYKLGAVSEAEITAIQGFEYVFGSVAPTTLADMLFCDSVASAPLAITVDQKVAAADHVLKRDSKLQKSPSSRIKKRAVTYSGCTAAQTSSLKTTVSDAIAMSKAASIAAGTGAAFFTAWFKSTSVAPKVQSIYNSVAGVQTTSPKISCKDLYDACSDGTALLYAIPSDKVIVPCPNNGYWEFPEFASTCANDDQDRAGAILHEATHLYGTEDWAYGSTAARALSATKASQNADTYEMYAGSVRLGGCSA